MDKKRLGNTMAICLVTVFMGQGYISPFSQWFRFSLAVLVLSLLLIYFKDLSVMTVSTSIGILMFIFRASLNFIAYPETTFLTNLLSYIPVAVFYIIFGFLFSALHIRDKLDDSPAFIVSLWFCDSSSNIAEAILSYYFIHIDFEKAVIAIIYVGLIRSWMTWVIYKIILYSRDIFEIEQKEKKFRELLLFTAKLNTELFFLKKSMIDIEDMMEQSYDLYERLEEPQLRNMALDISKNIHEIKKDYIRVVAGMENTLLSEKTNLHMSVEDVFKIIKDATNKLIEFKEVDISVKFQTQSNFQMNDYYPLISVLNNLITNSIDAIESTGEIVVEEYEKDGNHIFRVIDDGPGIEEEDMELIFEPGFTNKYDKTTGKMSTGIGLSHVKNIVENHFGGTIEINNRESSKTIFEMKIPVTNIEGSA
ncbi:MAG: ATP-binding protein [Anaeromicrobium sp.]|uniref:ATP-binding protein n=1 Tax=Anaeromicrobium sp. TaxID=1929132 RepID=UPI0025F14735|nr:ATP-binding protein [Anaeromicrobium sp.]MCT4595127.1 ATP-binding protein [Anaeromicrobium sp.]